MIEQYLTYVYALGIVILLSLLIWSVMRKVQNYRYFHIRDESLTVDELEEHAKIMSLEHAVYSKSNRFNWPITQMNENARYIRQVYEDLNKDIADDRAFPPAAEWLLDNYYVIEEQVQGLRKDLTKKNYASLPVLKKGPYQGFTRIYAIAMEMVANTHGQIEETTLLKYLNAYQSNNILFEREIYIIPAMLKLSLIENIKVICQDIQKTRKQWALADKTVDNWLNEPQDATDNVGVLFENYGKSINYAIETANPSYIEHLFYRLRRSGKRYSAVLRYIDEILDKFKTTTEIIAQKEHNIQAESTVSMGNCIVSIKHLSSLNWTDLYDEASQLEKILKEDPLKAYSLMDDQTRFYYKHRIEEIAKLYGVSELYIAKEAILLAQLAMSSSTEEFDEENQEARKYHVGYYIIDNGLKELEAKQKINNSFLVRTKNNIEENQGIIYMVVILSLTLIMTLLTVFYGMMHTSSQFISFAFLIGFAVIIPISEMVVSIINWIVGKIKKPSFFPRLELKNGIPNNMTAIVVIPAILSNKERVNELMENMENHYLSNREKNLYFALIGAFSDSDSEVNKDDKEILQEASQKITSLNQKYAKDKKDIFYFYNRQRIYNEVDHVWTGWERKRGALMEFNELLLGSNSTSFTYFSNPVLPDTNIRYVITLDADTILPLSMVKKMIGTMAHPLNKPVIDYEKGIVTQGYGLVQPRVSFDSDSSNRSVFSRIYTGQEGLDPYASAVSDVYQDLFDEGIFTGKGIYDLHAFQSVLADKFPENAILSHDLLEGSFVRAALVSELELVDSYPSKFNSFMARLHRWIRGDWQLMPWLFKGIYTKNDTRIQNPLSLISKWKIMDNLRRSLLAPSVMVLIAFGFSIFPGNGVVWVGIALASMGLPLALSLITHAINSGIRSSNIKRHLSGFIGIKASIFQFLLRIVFLPYQAYIALNAILVTLKRVFITKRNLLEWVTSSDTDVIQPNSLKSYVRSMSLSVITGAAIAVLPFYFKPENTKISTLLLIAWILSPLIAFVISKDDLDNKITLEESELLDLRTIGRKTWRYFEEFSNLKNNYLAPDNYQQDPYSGIAYKTSPTNIGLGIMASLSARDMGYVGIIEAEHLISRSISTIERMDKWNGHLYNWYDTRTLRPLRPMYVSTVDSGNMIGYFTALVQGLKEYYDKPLIDESYINGLNDTINASLIVRANPYTEYLTYPFTEDSHEFDPMLWYQTLKGYHDNSKLYSTMRREWINKFERMIHSYQDEIKSFMPWVDMSILEVNPNTDDELIKKFNELFDLMKKNVDLKMLPTHASTLIAVCDQLIQDTQKRTDDSFETEVIWLNQLIETAEESIKFTTIFFDRYNQLIQRITDISVKANFSTLYNYKRHLFSIGYDLETNTLTNSHYDLLASEARQTSYMAIARGEIPPKHWFKLGRALTVVDYFKGLVSWSGTMFEYLMPLVLMRSYRNTLLDETYSFVVKSQIKYGKQRDMPWGTSESAYHALDINLNYQYKAIGVPWLGLKRGLAEDAVVTPYATFLALMVDPKVAYNNIKKLREEGLEGRYGFYEAADYTPSRMETQTNNIIIKSYMAHHQGMSLLSINNYLNDFTMQKRFEKDPQVRSARLLLQERVPWNIVFTKESKEKIPSSNSVVYNEKSSYRRFTEPNFDLPKAHVLSNGKYFVNVTDKGTGYSRTSDATISRWRNDPIIDTYGTFFYIENLDKNMKWSAAYAPFNVVPEDYEVVFTSDKASYKRTDGDIETLSEIVVASGDSAEVRRIQLKNKGSEPVTIQVTSYFELVASTQISDLAHPAFNNLFVSTEYDATHKALLANRRIRSPYDTKRWVAEIPVIDGEVAGNIEFETDRSQFIGRGHTTANPQIIEQGKPLSNTVGSVLDPIFSIRTRVRIKPGHKARIFYVTAVADSKEAIMELIEKYNNIEACDTSFWLALTRSQVESKYLNIKDHEMELYQNLISDILFNSPQRRRYEQQIKNNTLGQESLWQFGISGDRPIVLLALDKIDEMELLFELLKAHEYWRLKNLNVDLVVLSREEHSYSNPLFTLITEIVTNEQAPNIINRHSNVFVLKANTMSESEINLFFATSKMIFEGSLGSMQQQSYSAILEDESEEQISILTNSQSDLVVFNQHEPLSNTPFLRDELEKHKELQFFNGFGGFGNNGKNYVITLETNMVTPAPWINVIANPNFGFLISESGGGYTWYENSRENKLTKWSNDAVCDEPSEVFYISDDTDNLWSLTPLPIREEEPYTIEHGFGYTSFRHQSHELEQELIQYVSVSDTIKVSKIRLHNISSANRELKITYYITPILGVSMKETNMHLVSSQSENGTLMIENPYNREFANKVCFVDTSVNDRTITGDKKEFFGQGGLTSPDALKKNTLSQTTGAGYDPCGAMQIQINLEPKETMEIVFVMGMADSKEEALHLATQFNTLEQAKDALNEVNHFWSNKLQTIVVETPDSSMNIMLNGWLQYQVISCRMWARSGFYQAGGAFGFRDQLQDSLSLLTTWPSLARAQIIKHASHQFEEGDVLHWWHEPTGKGTRTRISDDYLWLPYVTSEYIKKTGDFDILNSKAPFLQEEVLNENEEDRYCQPNVSKDKYTLYDHCIRSIENALRFGEHGLALIRGGDWNDGMNRVGIEGKGESIWLSWFLHSTLKKFIPICIEVGDKIRANEYSLLATKVVDAIETHGWDGDWYRRAYFDDGSPLGASSNSECKIDSLAQTWSAISGAANLERSTKAMNSLDNFLILNEEGIIKLLTPPFSDGERDPGYIKGYLPGVRENGGQYTHAAAWVVVAFSKLRDGNRAWKSFRMLNPINHALTLRESWIYKVEPYVMAADVYGENPHVGRGGWTWYTGAAGWMYNAGIESILGFYKEGEYLIFDPTIPDHWPSYSISYKYLETMYEIKINNTAKVSKGVKQVSVDGEIQLNHRILLVNDRKLHQVYVVMGSLNKK